ncbi:PTS sugar transporter subunit IIA [Novipirellula caenicola]|uniref:PTS EIIA type-2 domain-containing protein n=1 Tax=Novipirellula caenicola TaxID=1536901 RepID=A0ABP9W3Z2_9BACT
MTSTTTDDGTPIRCEICGASSLVNVSRPPGDSVCPNCGAFLWVDAVVEITRQTSFIPDMTLREIASTTRSDAVREITTCAAAEFDWTMEQQNELTDAILKREELGSTGIGNGFAVPHASVDWLASCVTVIAFAPNGIDFDSLDGDAVHTVILIASPKSKPGDHLRLLERVSRSIRFWGQSAA